jgi:integrase
VNPIFRFSRYGKEYGEVDQKLAEARGDAAKGLIFDAGNQTVGEYLERWLNDSVKGSVKPVPSTATPGW